MANITLSNLTFYNNGNSGASAAVGFANGVYRNARYSFIAPSSGATHISVSFAGSSLGDPDGYQPALRFYVGADPNSHANAGAGSTYTGNLALQSDGKTYSGEGDVLLTPGATYYVWVFQQNNNYGWCNWSRAEGAATAVTSGAALSTLSWSGDITLGQQVTFTVTQYSNTLTHSLTYAVGGAEQTIYSRGGSTSITWTPPTSLASNSPTGMTFGITFYLRTYNGTTEVGGDIYATWAIIPASIKPTCSVSVSDPTGYAATYGGYLQGLSKVAATISGSPGTGSSISSYSGTAFGQSYSGQTFTANVDRAGGRYPITAKVTDARGRSGEASTDITVLSYAKPAITAISVHRCNSSGTEDSNGDHVRVNFSSAVTPLSNKNNSSYVLNYKKSTDSDYTAVVLTDYANHYAVSNGQAIFAADTGSSYDVRVLAYDNFGMGSGSTSASTAAVLMNWRADGNGMGIGKVGEHAGGLDIGYDVYMASGKRITGLPAPSGSSDAVPKNYVDGKFDGHTHAVATESANGFMSAADKVKLNRYPNAHVNTTRAGSGYHKITINSYAEWMLTFTIRVYQAYRATDIMISGYNYIYQPGWYLPTAVILGSNNTDSTMDVYFGRDESGLLWVGIPSASYFGVTILNVVNGYQSVSTIDGLFTIEHQSSLTGTVQATTTAAPPASWGYVNARVPTSQTSEISANVAFPLTLENNRLYHLAYNTYSLSTADILLKVNGAAPATASYTYAGSGSNYTGGIFGRSGPNHYGTFVGFISVHNGLTEVWGQGRRGDNGAMGVVHMSWNTVASSITLNSAGQLTYTKLY